MKTKKLNGTSRNGAGARVTPQRLLVPVDFSDPSLRALAHAVRLAAEWDASLLIVHVVASEDGLFNIGREQFRDLDKALQKQAADELRVLAYAHVPDDVTADLEVRIGRPAEEIVAAARDAKATLIVLSTHGRTGLDRLLMGSVAERVAHLAPCPIYLIPGENLPAKREQARPAVLRLTHKR